MAHALAPHAAERHLDRALFANDALVLHALVLAAQALVVLDRPEDAGAEQTVALGFEGPVVDGLGLFDLAVGPGQNLLGARDRNPDLVEDLRRRLRAEKIHDFLVHRLLLGRLAAPISPSSSPGLPRRSRSGRHGAHLAGMAGPSPAVTLRAGQASCPANIHSAASAVPPPGACLELCRSTLRPSERISLTSTLKLSGMPASNVSSPRTIAS